jgi:hypothetical protein
MDSRTIEEILWATSRAGRKFFLGCFPSDRLPRHGKHSHYTYGIIANEDPARMKGSHWVAIFVKDKDTAYYFDSYAREPIPQLASYFNNFKNVIYNSAPFQSLFSETCAHYCIYVLFFASLGTPFEKILYTLSNYKNSDHSVSNFVKRLYHSLI